MKRKVFRNGPSLVVTLPAKWAKNWDIEEGTELEASINQNELTLQKESRGLGKAVIDTTNLDRTFLRCAIRSAYKKGFDEIVVEYKSPTLRHLRTKKDIPISTIVQEEVSSLIGFEVLEHNTTSIVIKGFSKESSEDMDRFLRRIFQKLILYVNSFADGYSEEALKDWENRHYDIKKLINYCTRLLNKTGYETNMNTPILYHLIGSIDIILDMVKYSGRTLMQEKIVYDKKVKNIVAEIIKSFSMFQHLFYNYSNKKVVEFSKLRNKIQATLFSEAKSISPRTLIFLHKLYETTEVFYLLIETRLGLTHD